MYSGYVESVWLSKNSRCWQEILTFEH